ncbi:hypothetical protein PoB_005246600 [Plakobranchus ocellatus]|uniref:Secreted protein n=1 Tax=Plakobranchus ocellatus TaxID=259542 RepID=A0AAV4BRU8_9GAST|nr:hypothetical protein PoB_005246600 [Plakobranchus ocellatus]
MHNDGCLVLVVSLRLAAAKSLPSPPSSTSSWSGGFHPGSAFSLRASKHGTCVTARVGSTTVDWEPGHTISIGKIANKRERRLPFILPYKSRGRLEQRMTGKRRMVFAEPDGKGENKHDVIQLSLMKFVQFLAVSTSSAFMSASMV